MEARWLPWIFCRFYTVLNTFISRQCGRVFGIWNCDADFASIVWCKKRVLTCFIFSSSCKKWDPNLQYYSQISSQENLYSEKNDRFQSNGLEELKLGQSLAEVIKIIGNEYRILASLKNKGNNWVKIEILEMSKSSGGLPGKSELLFKNNTLIKIEW